MKMEENSTKEQKLAPWYWSCRFSVAIMGFLGFMVMNAQRISMSVAIVCMVNQTAVMLDHQEREGTDESQMANVTEATCHGAEANATAIIPRDGEFVWSKPVQGLILGSFFWGYMMSQIPAGWLADKIGGRKVFGGFMIIMSLATILHPVGARVHYKFLITLRFFAGVGAGVSYPAMHALWGHWAPPMERSKLAGISYAGSQIGNVIALPLAGILCEYGFDGGWPSIFYILGSFGLLWCILWLVLIGDTPATDRRITQAELEFITESLRGQVRTADKKHKVPIKSILTSCPLWAIVVANMMGDMGFYTFETSMPSYLREVLKFDVKTNGLFSAAPYIVYFAAILGSGLISDALRSSGLLSTTNTRKLMEIIGKGTTAITIIILGFLDCSQWPLAMALLICGVGINGFQFSGYVVNHVDIAPKYAGLLMGITNCLAGVSGFAGPYMVGSLTQDQSRENWQKVFYIIAGCLTFGIIFYCIFGSGEVQPWATDEDEEQEVEKSKLNGLSVPVEDGDKPMTEMQDMKNGHAVNGYCVAEEEGLMRKV